MAIKSKEKMREITLDLTGPDGNAFALMGIARKLARQCDMDDGKILDEMKNGDYEHLVNTFDRYFGHFVTLYR